MENATFRATVVGVAGDPPLLYWRGGTDRPLSGAAPVPDHLLASARAIPAGAEARLVVETDWEAAGAPTRLVSIDPVAG